jgi:hypothetical protein
MGQLLHGSARTTAAVRRAIQYRQESRAKLASRDDLRSKTVAKWKKRTQVHDAPRGPKQPRSTGLTVAEEALMVAFRKPTLLPLNDCLSTWQATRPYLTRSARHRGLPRPDISRLPDLGGEKLAKKELKSYAIGSFPIDIVEVRTAEGQRYVFVAIDRICKCADAEWHEETNTMVAAQFRRKVIAAVPYTV